MIDLRIHMSREYYNFETTLYDTDRSFRGVTEFRTVGGSVLVFHPYGAEYACVVRVSMVGPDALLVRLEAPEDGTIDGPAVFAMSPLMVALLIEHIDIYNAGAALAPPIHVEVEGAKLQPPVTYN